MFSKRTLIFLSAMLMALQFSVVSALAEDSQADIFSKIATRSDGTTATGAPVVIDTSINTGAVGSSTFMVIGNANKERIELRAANPLFTYVTPTFQAKGATGTIAAPGATLADMYLGGLGGSGHDGTQWVTPNRAYIGMKAAETWSPTSQGSYITLETTPIGSAGGAGTRVERVRVAQSGNVGIGVTAPNQKLEVAGGIKINPSGSQPVCDDNTRGTFWFSHGVDDDDTVEVCAKISGVNTWKKVYWQ